MSYLVYFGLELSSIDYANVALFYEHNDWKLSTIQEENAKNTLGNYKSCLKQNW